MLDSLFPIGLKHLIYLNPSETLPQKKGNKESLSLEILISYILKQNFGLMFKNFELVST